MRRGITWQGRRRQDWPGRVKRSATRLGKAGRAQPGSAGLGLAGRSAVRHNMARQAKQGAVRRGITWPDRDRQGRQTHGMAIPESSNALERNVQKSNREVGPMKRFIADFAGWLLIFIILYGLFVILAASH